MIRKVLAAAGLVVAFAGGLVAARATPGGATKNHLSFAGNIKGGTVTSGTAVKFSFYTAAAGGAASCTSTWSTETNNPDSAGNFVADLDLGTCAAFDGADLWYTITVGAAAESTPRVPLNPVPYAKYADKAAVALTATTAAAAGTVPWAGLPAYCGATSTTPGNLSGVGGSGVGHAKARAACQTVSACGATGHLCSAEELGRSLQLGASVPVGWYSGMANETGAGGDCSGWTSNSVSYNGPVLDSNATTGGREANSHGCSGTWPLLCCR